MSYRIPAIRKTAQLLTERASRNPKLSNAASNWLLEFAAHLEGFEKTRHSRDKSEVYSTAKAIKTIRREMVASKHREGYLGAVEAAEAMIGKKMSGKQQELKQSPFAQEIRTALRQMTKSERLSVSLEAVKANDPHMVAALHDAPSYLTGIDPPELEKIREMIDYNMFSEELELQKELIEVKALVERLESDATEDFAAFEKTNKGVIAEVESLLSAVS